MRHLVDTNILLRWTDKASPEHILCANVIESLKQSTETWICAQALIEYYGVATRPREVNGLGMDIAVAQSALMDILEALPCLPEPPDIGDRWRAVAFENNVRGKQVHDARMVAVMLAHGVTNILTLNPGDFTRYQGIRPTSPDDIVRASQ